jgi:hypothetical protein
MGTLDVAPRANEIKATGTLPLGAFSEDDRRVLRRSVQDTLSAVDWPATATAPTWLIHIYLRRSLVAHSSSNGGVLICVSWCLADEGGRVVHSEQFYASTRGSDAPGKATLGKVRDVAHPPGRGPAHRGYGSPLGFGWRPGLP